MAFPQLGCGNGELDWESEVRPLMERYLKPLPIHIYIHLYDSDGRFEHQDQEEMMRWLRADPSSLAFSEVWDDLVKIAPSIEIEYGTSGMEEALLLGDTGEEVTVVRSDLMSLWMRLRSFGFLADGDIPDVYREVDDSIIGIFRQLPYVRSIRFGMLVADRQGASIAWNEGVGLLPEPVNPSHVTQLDLLALVP